MYSLSCLILRDKFENSEAKKVGVGVVNISVTTTTSPFFEPHPFIQNGLFSGHRLTWKAYHRLTDIHGYIDYLAETYPNLCTVETIGNSVEGRPLKILRISSGNNRSNNQTKSVWVDGGIHAREWISPATVTYIINNFVLNYENEPQSVRDVDWYFLPVVNPDGYEYSHMRDRLWRKNRARAGFCAGTDLNRNFG